MREIISHTFSIRVVESNSTRSRMQSYSNIFPSFLLADWLCRDMISKDSRVRAGANKARDCCSSQRLPNEEGLVMEEKQSG